MMFYVGQRVVCVDDGPLSSGGVAPFRRGAIYTVKALTMVGTNRDGSRGLGGITLCEVPDPPHRPRYRPAYCATRFAPVRTQSIQIFHDIANGVKQPEKENA